MKYTPGYVSNTSAAASMRSQISFGVRAGDEHHDAENRHVHQRRADVRLRDDQNQRHAMQHQTT